MTPVQSSIGAPRGFFQIYLNGVCVIIIGFLALACVISVMKWFVSDFWAVIIAVISAAYAVGQAAEKDY